MIKKLNENDLFASTDMCLCGVLLYSGFRLESIDKHDPAKAVFYWEREKGLDETIQAFWAGETRTEPKRFFNCIKEIKSRLYAQE